MLNKILLSELENPDREIKIITRSPNQYRKASRPKVCILITPPLKKYLQ